MKMSKDRGLEFFDAYKKVLESIKPSLSKELVPLQNAYGRVLASDIIAVKNAPSFDNSALDGYAFEFKNNTKRYKISTTIFAGDKPKPSLKEGECYKIMTGAIVPNDADTVVAWEDCEVTDDGFVEITKDIKKGNAVRVKGEEVKAGERLIEKGERLDFSHIALLASQGVGAVEVYKKLQIAVISSGNELKEPWQSASEDEIYNANSFAVMSLLKKFGYEADYIGLIPDSLEESAKQISSLKNYDVIISSGGVSQGEADFLKKAYIKNSLGTLFHGVNVKPGHPTLVGKMEDTLVLAMPGNPLASLLNIFVLGLPALMKLQGANRYYLDYVVADNVEEFFFKQNRSDIVLGKIENASFKVIKKNKIGSGMLTPLVQSNCVAVMSEEKNQAQKNESLKVLLFDAIFSKNLVDFRN
jgi:molybdopterin molybdotransferase